MSALDLTRDRAADATRGATDVTLTARCIAAVRALSVDMVEQARSGHPGAPLGLAPAATVLFTRVMRHSPRTPDWPDRDRFVLSAGHASALLYSLLHLTGYAVSAEDLRRFRQWGAITPGHPEHGLTPGVETTTGPLGQGFANAVGLAIAERILARRFNRDGLPIVDHRVYGICSDGDLMEGVASEAASLAGHLGLSRLILLYDDNGITIDGPTGQTFTEDVARRFDAYGWQTLRVEDGNDTDSIEHALRIADADPERPSLIAVRTRIGFGSAVEGTAAAHGAPLGPEDARRTKARMAWTEEPFVVPDDVAAEFAATAQRGAAAQARWRLLMAQYEASFPEDSVAFADAIAGRLPDGWDRAIPRFPAGSSLATRKASAASVQALWPRVEMLAGGSADLAESTGMTPPGDPFRPGRADRIIHFGVREHAMGGIMNGLALHGGIRPVGSTFLVFSDYMRPPIRLAALMGQPAIFVFTHDSIGLGEDGPTHQPVEHLAALRAIPGLTVIRPADANETAIAWRVALSHGGPVALVLTRQDVPVLDAAKAGSAGRGAYTLADSRSTPDVILIGTGSEVHVALAARDILDGLGIAARVVSMPSWELFAEQTDAYRSEILPSHVRARVSVEAAATMGWERWIGERGVAVGVDRFGASAPGPEVMRELGITPEMVARRALETVTRT